MKTSLRKIQQKTPMKIKKITKQKNSRIAIPRLPRDLESKISTVKQIAARYDIGQPMHFPSANLGQLNEKLIS